MNLHQYYRTHNPEIEFETRPLHCADGLTRVVSLSLWFWEKLDLLLNADGGRNIKEITHICLKQEQIEVKENDEFDHAFVELLMYYIWLNFNSYCQFYNGYANDNYDSFYPQPD